VAGSAAESAAGSAVGPAVGSAAGSAAGLVVGLQSRALEPVLGALDQEKLLSINISRLLA
jgi:hypothetical protein